MTDSYHWSHPNLRLPHTLIPGHHHRQCTDSADAWRLPHLQRSKVRHQSPNRLRYLHFKRPGGLEKCHPSRRSKVSPIPPVAPLTVKKAKDFFPPKTSSTYYCSSPVQCSHIRMTAVKRHLATHPAHFRSFKHKALQRLYEGAATKELPPDAVSKLRAMFAALDQIEDVKELKTWPFWRVQVRSGDRKGTWSLHVNHNWRLTFQIEKYELLDLDFEDYYQEQACPCTARRTPAK